jgi:hypothetical protein
VADPAPTPSAATFAVTPVSITIVPAPAPLWQPLRIPDALRQIAAMDCAVGQPAAIEHLGLALHTTVTGTQTVPSCPGAWRAATSGRVRASHPVASHPTTTSIPPKSLPITTATTTAAGRPTPTTPTTTTTALADR